MIKIKSKSQLHLGQKFSLNYFKKPFCSKEKKNLKDLRQSTLKKNTLKIKVKNLIIWVKYFLFLDQQEMETTY